MLLIRERLNDLLSVHDVGKATAGQVWASPGQEVEDSLATKGTKDSKGLTKEIDSRREREGRRVRERNGKTASRVVLVFRDFRAIYPAGACRSSGWDALKNLAIEVFVRVK